ncbi:hypothetical protein IVB08_34455 [Bradyrhizobium sp. 173]|uniref:hypothetical protein n=1 Tax=Bradyrhizobium sp. 173 TaxID=2782644 RepID=UPI001FFB0718|nr:hypothetical protein [Bradyrhizobium sp. 173]MCK1568962.1 hypothetical protein [Bradyrhizobium sp. 173]
MSDEMGMLLIAKDDSKIGFNARVCNRETLTVTVFQALFGVPFAAEHHKEVAEICAGLLKEGRFDFEDGWIELRTGVADVASFFTMQLQDAKEEEDAADKLRFEEMQKRKAAEKQYADLRDALSLAIGKGAKAANLEYVLGASQ